MLPAIHHLGYVVEDLHRDVPRFAAAGPASAVWFAGGARFGHPIEVLERRDELLGFYAMVREAAVGRDGSEPLRIMTGAPA
jgi:hypothetical protein